MQSRTQEQPLYRALSLVLLVLVVLSGASGCTSRGMTITSLPEGAEVSINRRVVGKTPIRVNFTHYGTYRIELRKERYETVVKDETISPPWYGYDPFTVVADNLLPARINDETYLHYVLKPVGEGFDKENLMARAVLAREGKAVNPRTGKEITVEMAAAQPQEPVQPGFNTTPPQPGTEPKTPSTPITPTTPRTPGTPGEVVPLTPDGEKRPAPPRLGNELGLTPPEEPKQPLPLPKPDEDKKPAPPRLGQELGITPPEEPKKEAPKTPTPAPTTPNTPSTPTPGTPTNPTTPATLAPSTPAEPAPTPDAPKPPEKRTPPKEQLPFDDKK
jgi:hypothetical protein